MNRAALIALVYLAACQPAPETEKLELALGDVENYADYLEEIGERETPEPFEAEPLEVRATGKVRAVPDIAVITATIRAEDVNESAAADAMGRTINAVQAALAGRAVETGFTAVTSEPRYDQDCLNQNSQARQRHAQIQSDYWFNKRLDDRGDTETKRRDPRPRLAQIVCQAEKLRLQTRMVIRVEPADVAGEVLLALSDAGAHTADLYGYDFSDYDGLYQNAAEAAVRQARAKARAVADGAGGALGDLVGFSVSRPARVGRFGPQPSVIRPPRPYAGPDGSVVDRHLEESDRYRPPPPPPPAAVYDLGPMEDEIVVTASRRRSDSRSYTTATTLSQEASSEIVTLPDGRTVERMIPAVTKQEIVRVEEPSTPDSNALAMSLMSGPQDIEVTAVLVYAYDTPLTGKIITVPEDDG